MGQFVDFARGWRRGLFLTVAVALCAPVGASAAGPSGTCQVSPGQGNVWNAADTAAAREGHALWGSVYDTGAWRFFANGNYGRQANGRSVDVALIDSGVAPVPGLDAGNVVHGPDLSFESQSNQLAHIDTNGHGTMMASLIAGRDVANPGFYDYNSPFELMGMAPQSRVVSIKVADSQGAVDVTQVIAAIDWAVAHAHDAPSKANPTGFNIRVINLSYGVFADDASTADALSYAVEQAWKAGIVVVAASGNSGRAVVRDSPGLASPAYNTDVIAVGAYDDNATPGNHRDDFVPPFTSGSSRTNTRMPDLAAPAEHITGLHVKGATEDDQMLQDCIDAGGPSAWTRSVFGPNDRFIHGSGTSEAAALVSGAVALIFSVNPTLQPETVKKLLEDTAIPFGASHNLAGEGAINLSDAFVATPKLTYEQNHDPVVGGSSLDAARGTSVVNAYTELVTGACTNYWNNQMPDGTVRDVASEPAFESAFTRSCVLAPLDHDRSIFGTPIVVGNRTTGNNTLQGAESVGADGRRKPHAWAKRGPCEKWLGMPMTGAALTKDKRPGMGLTWAGCKWPSKNWAGKPWTTDSVHRWSAQGFWTGGWNWQKFSLTGSDWTKFALRDNDWS